MFYDRYLYWCNKIGKTPSAVAIEIGLKKSSVTRWKNGGGVTDATAKKVADYFGLTITEFLEEQKEKPATETGDGKNEVQKLIGILSHMSDEQIKQIFNYAVFLDSQE